jgi:hypothetical protein
VNEASSERLELSRTWIAVAILRSLGVSGIPPQMQEEPLNRKTRVSLPPDAEGTNLTQILFCESFIGCALSRNKTFWMPRLSLSAPRC